MTMQFTAYQKLAVAYWKAKPFWIFSDVTFREAIAQSYYASPEAEPVNLPKVTIQYNIC